MLEKLQYRRREISRKRNAVFLQALVVGTTNFHMKFPRMFKARFQLQTYTLYLGTTW